MTIAEVVPPLRWTRGHSEATLGLRRGWGSGAERRSTALEGYGGRTRFGTGMQRRMRRSRDEETRRERARCDVT
jgi:hypothetical protein